MFAAAVTVMEVVIGDACHHLQPPNFTIKIRQPLMETGGSGPIAIGDVVCHPQDLV